MKKGIFNIKAIIFDFDGVITESIDIKTKAFRELFKDYPWHLDAIERFHLENGGMSRFKKFRFIYKNIIKKPLSKSKFEELCQRFERLVVKEVTHCPFVKGAPELLKYCLRRFDIFVVSGTPQSEIRQIIKKRKLTKYFRGIFGSPTTKPKIIRNILKRHKYLPKDTLFIGDSLNDYKAAKNTGVKFIARVTDGRQPWLKDKRYIISRFKDMFALKNYLKEQIPNYKGRKDA
jgi:HAD superfamily hydrolase (TIGR01549 family)